jgi:hypothetical protein
MDEYKIFLRFPLIIFLSYILFVLLYGASFVYFIIYGKLMSIIIAVVGLLLFSFGLSIVIRVNYFNKYFYTINRYGIAVDQVGLLKKYLKWDAELYYMITKSYFKAYSYKKMIPMTGKIINSDNIEHGYIIIKTKDALKIKHDNKKMISIMTKGAKNNIKIDDVVNMINVSRGITG